MIKSELEIFTDKSSTTTCVTVIVKSRFTSDGKIQCQSNTNKVKYFYSGADEMKMHPLS